MTPHAFQLTLSHAAPSRALDAPAAALWWARKGDWQKAHRLVMDETSRGAAWAHAWLHRVEGDIDNARYWYRQARHHPASGDFDTEWETIITDLLGRQG